MKSRWRILVWAASAISCAVYALEQLVKYTAYVMAAITGISVLFVVYSGDPKPAYSPVATFNYGSASIRYSVDWGWGMSESITFADLEYSGKEKTVSSDIFKKPYLSGALIYSEGDNDHLDIKLGKQMSGQLMRYSTKTGLLTPIDICSVISGSSRLYHPIKQGASNKSARPSIYYPGRIFLGTFSIIGSGRGEGVTFTFADALEAEPPLDEGECP